MRCDTSNLPSLVFRSNKKKEIVCPLLTQLQQGLFPAKTS
jgi:hypothetical protein